MHHYKNKFVEGRHRPLEFAHLKMKRADTKERMSKKETSNMTSESSRSVGT